MCMYVSLDVCVYVCTMYGCILDNGGCFTKLHPWVHVWFGIVDFGFWNVVVACCQKVYTPSFHG